MHRQQINYKKKWPAENSMAQLTTSRPRVGRKKKSGGAEYAKAMTDAYASGGNEPVVAQQVREQRQVPAPQFKPTTKTVRETKLLSAVKKIGA